MKKFKIDNNYSVFYNKDEYIFETNAGVAYTNYSVDDVSNDVTGSEAEDEFNKERSLVENIVSEDRGSEFTDYDEMGIEAQTLAKELGW